MKGILPYRGNDIHGSGVYGASRGNRTHRGIDVACWPGTIILACQGGQVTKLGYPYRDDLSWRYVEVTGKTGARLRYFYINPIVDEGEEVSEGQALGHSQDLRTRYRDITPHVHFEVIRDGKYVNPEGYL